MAPETLAPEVEGILFPEIESTDYCDACGTEKIPSSTYRI